MPYPSSRRGISRIDIIVAVALLCLVGQFVLPAIPRARELARAHQCRSNLRNLAVALNNYHDQFAVFPPAATWGSDGLDLKTLGAHEFPTPIHVSRQNWLQLLLPALNQSTLASRFDPAYPVADAANRDARLTSVSSLTCPSDPFNRRDNLYRMPLPDGTHVEFARGNYAINGGSEFVPADFGTLSNPGPTHSRYVYDEADRSFQFLGNGIAGINRSLSLRDCRNGLATLVAAEEIRAGLAPIDTRGVWALGQIGASITWGHGVIGDDGAPNATEKDASADDIRFGKELYSELGRDFIDGERMQACDHCDDNDQATARSKHEGGVHIVTLDGAVHFVSDNIEPTVWHIMHSRETPKELLEERFVEEIKGRDANFGRPAGLTAKQRLSGSLPQDLDNSVGMKFVRVPAGDFMMGLADKDLIYPFPSDVVPHRVNITRDFLMGRHEVTQSQYQQVMGVNPSWHVPSDETRAIIGTEKTDDWPVESVAWEDAVEFCRRLSQKPEEVAAGRTYRLPTEAEWEYTCRGGIREPILRPKWEDAIKTGETASNRIPSGTVLLPKPVGSYPPNPFGVYDMCGNVYEWTSDYRRQGYYSHSPTDDPTGPAIGYLHVIRGWYWVATGPNCKVYVSNEPWVGSRLIGFRVICEVAKTSRT